MSGMVAYHAGLIVTLGWIFIGSVFAAEQQEPGRGQTPAMGTAESDLTGQQPELMSAFFGLDNRLSNRVERVCPGGAGQDGMPVVLSHTVDPTTLQPGDFQVVTRSGVEHTPLCATLWPAGDPGELRTVLLIGDFGDASDDPPVLVRVVGDLDSDSEPSVNFGGLQTGVIPLAAGPSLALASVVPESEWPPAGGDRACPEGIRQVVRVTWTGGVRLPDGDELGDPERLLYRVVVERRDGSSDAIAPVALGDLEDRDNNHLLCLDTADPVVSVSFPGGHLIDPNRDLNPDTRVTVGRAAD